MGPGFVLTLIPKSAKNMSELRNAYLIKHRVHIMVMIGGALLLISGLLMGAINPALFRAGWYVTSLILFLLALASGPFILKPLSRPIKELLATYEGEDIPKQYDRLIKRLDLTEHIANIIFLIVIALMILKPF